MGPNKYLHYPALARSHGARVYFYLEIGGRGRLTPDHKPQHLGPSSFQLGTVASSRGKFAELSTSYEEHK